MSKTEEYSFKRMTDSEISESVLSAISDIRESYYKYGEIIITISGGNVKHIDVRKPWETKKCNKFVNTLDK